MFTKKMIFAVCLAVFPSFAHSATIALDTSGAWTEFRFDLGLDGGAWLEPNDNLEVVSFTVSLTRAATLQVSDAYRAGDRFEVLSNGAPLGLTSVPTTIGDEVGNDYDLALSDVRWSSGSWTLDAGDHTITGFVRDMPEERGRGALRIVAIPEVPLPGTFPLTLAAGMVLGAFTLRKRRAAAKVVQ